MQLNPAQIAIKKTETEQTCQKIDIIAPVLIVENNKAYWLNTDGEVLTPNTLELNNLIQKNKPILCHAEFIAKKLNILPFQSYDLLELFAFVCPAKFCTPNILGLSKTLNLDTTPTTIEEKAVACLEITNILLQKLKDNIHNESSDAISIAFLMGLGKEGMKNSTGWAWSHIILDMFRVSIADIDNNNTKNALKIWNRLPEWAEEAPPPPAGHLAISENESIEQLKKLLQAKNTATCNRIEQEIYTRHLNHSFMPKNHEDDIKLTLAEAGTGTGKTLGYLAPASLWADKNEGCVWISTYTKNLQKQIDEELNNLYKDKSEKSRNVVIRKGRENYLCLLNLEEAVNSQATQNNAKQAIGLGLIARWAAKTRDGDLYGGDFPGWLVGLLGWKYTYGLADRRGECMFSACSHYHKCFVEKSNRLAKRAKIVIANHALVMHKTAASHPSDVLANRYIFDEGHHIFSAADSAFAVHLSGGEAAELRRWILGLENSNNRNSRNRGLKRRIEDLIGDDDEAQDALDDILKHAKILPSKSWRQRLQAEQPKGLMEGFLFLVRQQIYARNENQNDILYSLETEALPPIDGIFETAYTLSLRLKDMVKPINKIIKILQARLEKYSDSLESDTKAKIESVCHSLNYRAENLLLTWIDMLNTLQSQQSNENFVDWFQLERIEGKELDVGMYRHWIDPTIPFANTIKPYAHGIAITSASLVDRADANQAEWEHAEKHLGASNLVPSNKIKKLQIKSPYDYSRQSKIIVINDVNINKLKQVAFAYAALFKAAKGGALGLFTAIQRLKYIHAKLLPELEESKITLYSQHIDNIDTSSLTAIFKDEEDSCMLGTDAVRDGMDVPGRSLRLIVYDRVPWPRPDILHKARRKYFGSGYDDKITRTRLKQAYGRLIRHENDKGVFVMLDSRLPSRLCSAFPDDVKIERVGLADAVNIVKSFL